ncbi:PKD domain-containing protein [Vulgatibacter sp.]|uniref:PKD domain-containing protein n=1 Tax=Vulgatibacter sp. TaxID=1971226 RepID=UPI003567C8FE
MRGIVPGRRPGRWGRAIGGGLALCLGMWGSSAAADHVAGGHLVEVGPTGDHGFPIWYRDAQGQTLELCLDHTNPLCNFLPGDVPDPTRPISFPDNFPGEAFWWMAEAAIPTSAGDAALTLALEAAWAAEEVIDGDQVAFGRVRIRIDALQAGVYTVTHPFGVDVFEIAAGGDRAINYTEDIGGGPLDFNGAMTSRIGPFLQWSPIADAPAGYVGDPAVPHAVSGSPFGTNFFRVEGPGIGTAGSPNLCDSDGDLVPDVNCIETQLFNLQGRISTTGGVNVPRAIYARGELAGGTLSVFASSAGGQQIEVSGDGVPLTAFVGDGARYIANVDFTGDRPQTVTVTNQSDVPPSSKTVQVRDQVTILRAEWDPVARQLLVEAHSSDRAVPPTLQAVGFGPLASGIGVFADVVVPPPYVTVTSSAGGSDSEPVMPLPGGFTPVPVQANAGADLVAQQGQIVTLNGSASSGAMLAAAWTQLAGPSVVLLGADTLRPSFVAPAEAATLTFQLQIEGAGGPSTDTVDVVVQAVAPPVADAGADQVAVMGTQVTLDGTASQGTTAYAWTQIGGAPVTLAGADTANPSFTFPLFDTTLVFQLTVSGPGGTAVDVVEVSAFTDVLTVARAQYRRGKREWDVEGTASIPLPNVVSIYLADGVTRVGVAAVDAAGAWRFRERQSAVAPEAGETLIVRSSVGGELTGVPLNLRN